MKIKYLLSTGLLIHAGCAAAWVLDESVTVSSNSQTSASDTIQADFFESTDTRDTENKLPSALNLGELLSTNLNEPIAVLSEPKIPEFSTPAEHKQKHPHLEKKVSALTPKDLANKRYNLALQKIELQQSAEAEKIFLEILNNYPQHTLSRVQLSKLSILKNDYGKAEKLLTENPDYFSTHPAYLQTLALIYERTGKKQEALKVLEQVPAEHRKNVEFYSLLASLYQQTGNHVLAQRYYHGLLNREPNNTNWLLGLSISLDSGGDKKMAITYYRQTLEKGGLDPKIISFVKTRLNQLSKR